MDRALRILRFEVPRERSPRSLNEFVRLEVNPLLDMGWVVTDLSIDPRGGNDEPCAISVVLAPTARPAAAIPA